MPVLPNMGITTPTLGGDSGTWDDKINTALEVIDGHDHSAGNGTRVPVDGLNIDEDLPCGGFGLTNVGRVKFTQIAAPADAIALYVSSADNELYWRTFSGTNVKLTSGTTINTSLVGGIAGDYSTVGAEVAYDDASDRYTFKQQGSPKPWARLACGDVRIYETGTTESVFVGLKAPAALAASYDLTFATALPASTSIALVSAAGDVSYTNTVPNAVTFSTSISTPTVAGTPNFTGAVTMASTLGVTGVATFTVGPVAPEYKHNALTHVIAGASAQESGGPAHTRNNAGFVLAASTNQVIYPIQLKVGDIITGFTVYVRKGSAAGTMAATLCSTNGTTGSEVTYGSSASNSANNPGYVTLTISGLSETIVTAEAYYLRLVPSGNGSENALHAVVTYKRGT